MSSSLAHPGPPPEFPERPEGLPPRDPMAGPPDRWSPWSGLLALISALGIVILLGAVASGIAVAAGADVDDLPDGLEIGLTYFQDGVFIAMALVFARLVARPRASHFGLRVPKRIWKTIGILLLVWGGFYLFSGIWVAIVGGDSDTSDQLDSLGARDSHLALWLVMGLVTVLAPIAEELLFRGLFFRALRNWHGVWPAAILTGAAFGAIHVGSADAVALLPLGVFGFGLCLLYHFSGSLLPCIALHALNNAVAFSVGQKWDWQIPLVMVGATVCALALAVLGARLLDRGQGAATAAHVA